jgi:peptide-methionine (S)-S-oxide reductase
MKFLKAGILLAITLFTTSCESKIKNKIEPAKEVVLAEKYSKQDLQKYETAYFASGCFWCVEAIFESVKGVKEVISGYAGGTEENPTYEQVSYGKTSHAEAVEVYYDPTEISYI